MMRNRQRCFGASSQSSRSGTAARRRRTHWLLEGLEDRVLLSGSPTVYTVTDTTDSVTDTGSLRYAITQANTNTNLLGSEIVFDQSVFPPSSGGVITLSSPLELSEKDGKEMIDGTVLTNPPPAPLANAGVSIVGNSGFTAFTVDAGVTASFSGLGITGANNGILNNGTLAVTNCTFEDNGGPSVEGGDIFNYGTMTITGSFISGVRFEGTPAEGGIANYGTMTVDESTIQYNGGNGAYGGGIYNVGSLKVTDSTIANNSAEVGGGIFNAGIATVINSTIADNYAGLTGESVEGVPGGGGIASNESLTLVNCTVADNFTAGVSGGGLYVEGGSATLDNTIVALNTNQASPNQSDDPNDIAGTVAPDSAYNLIGTGGSGGLTEGANHNLVGLDPGLGVLGDNGGPTQTIPLLGGGKPRNQCRQHCAGHRPHHRRSAHHRPAWPRIPANRGRLRGYRRFRTGPPTCLHGQQLHKYRHGLGQRGRPGLLHRAGQCEPRPRRQRDPVRPDRLRHAADHHLAQHAGALRIKRS